MTFPGQGAKFQTEVREAFPTALRMVSSIVGALDGDLEAGKITRGLLVPGAQLGAHSTWLS